MKKKYLILILALLLSAFAGCTNSSQEENIDQNPKVLLDESSDSKDELSTLTKLRFAMMPSDSSAPIVLAKKLGYFEEVGIDAELNLFFSAKDRDSALLSGNLDAADYDLITAITSISNGSKFKVAYRSNGDFKLVSSQVELDNIEGKSVGISENTIIEYYVDKIVSENNIDNNSIKKEIIPQIPVRLQMLESGKLDMALLPDPLASLSTLKGARVLANSSDYGENIGAFIFTDEFIDKNPETIKSFAMAYDKAAKFIDENDNEAYIDYLISDLGFPEPVRETLELVEFGKLKIHEKETFEEVLSWLNDKKLLEKEVSYDEIMLIQ